MTSCDNFAFSNHEVSCFPPFEGTTPWNWNLSDRVTTKKRFENLCWVTWPLVLLKKNVQSCMHVFPEKFPKSSWLSSNFYSPNKSSQISFGISEVFSEKILETLGCRLACISVGGAVIFLTKKLSTSKS